MGPATHGCRLIIIQQSSQLEVVIDLLLKDVYNWTGIIYLLVVVIDKL